MTPRSEELLREILDMDQTEQVWLSNELLRRSESLPLSISRTPGVCGGEACVVGTRIPVRVLEQLRRQGLSKADILHSYPSLQAKDLVHAWVCMVTKSSRH